MALLQQLNLLEFGIFHALSIHTCEFILKIQSLRQIILGEG